MISARPSGDEVDLVAKSWKTRTGSSELRTVTALVRRIVRGARGDGGERDGGGGDGEVAAVVLADAEDVEAELLGQLGLLEQVACMRCSG